MPHYFGIKMIDPEIQLDHTERAHLMALVTAPGWEILLHKIMEPEAEKFKVAHFNSKTGDTGAIMESYHIAKAAAQFLVAIVNRLNYEHGMYLSAGKKEGTIDNPLDITKDSLYLGGEEEK